MHIRRKRGWELPESRATPEAVFRGRRRLIKAAAAGPILLAAASLVPGAWHRAFADADPTLEYYPAPRDPKYKIAPRPLTPAKYVESYNNFYEFGSQKDIADAAQKLKIRPWEIAVDGLVENKFTIGFDDLLAKVALEERLYRHRCVEAWSFTVPWTGFPLKSLVDMARPLGSAKYLKMTTFQDPEVAPGQRQVWYPWPYTEALTMAEAVNELAFLVTGAYGKPLEKQNGAPIRLHVPWKYGFKSAKSLVRFTFTEDRPKTFWDTVQGNEYGFWANVNPKVPHPRWSQATERVLGTDERIPTQLFNGYAEYVASIYKGLEGQQLYR